MTNAYACVFCARVARGECTSTPVPGVVRFEPLNPVTPGHLLFVPAWHCESAGDDPVEAGAAVTAAALHGAGTSFNIITSCGTEATQTVFHLHVHFVPRRSGDGLALPWTGQRYRPHWTEEDNRLETFDEADL